MALPLPLLLNIYYIVGEVFDETKVLYIDTGKLRLQLMRSKLKRFFFLGKDFMVKKIWEEADKDYCNPT